MKQKNKKTKMPLSGRNIYVDKKNRRVFYKARTKQGYVISEQHESQFQTFSNRYLIAAITFIVSYFFLFEAKVNPIVSIIIAGIAYTFCEYKYRKLLELCPMIQNFNPETAELSSKDYGEVDPNLLILRTILYSLLGILLIVNLFITEGMLDSILTIVISCAGSLYAAYTAINYIIALAKISKKK